MEKSNPEPVKLFIALIRNPAIDREEIVESIRNAIGTVQWISGEYPFNTTDYYEEEMGRNLLRSFIAMETLISPERIVETKHETDRMEEQWQVGGKRRVNLDPGYLDYTKIVLASAKPGGWKIYAGGGVWADMTLYYAKGSFIRFGWTFPDFRSGRYDNALLKIRSIYKKQRLQSQRPLSPL